MTNITSLSSTHAGNAGTSDASQVAVLKKHLANLEKQRADASHKTPGSHADEVREDQIAQQMAAIQAQIAQLAEQAAQKAAQKAEFKQEDVQQVQEKQDLRNTDARDRNAKARAVASGSKVGTNIDTFV